MNKFVSKEEKNTFKEIVWHCHNGNLCIAGGAENLVLNLLLFLAVIFWRYQHLWKGPEGGIHYYETWKN